MTDQVSHGADSFRYDLPEQSPNTYNSSGCLKTATSTQRSVVMDGPPCFNAPMDIQRIHEKKPSSGCMKFCLVGCAVTTTLMVTSIVVAFLLLRSKGPVLVAKTLTFISDKAVTDLEISEEQKDRIRAQLKRLSVRLEEGKLSFEDMRKIMKDLEQGSFPPLLFLEMLKGDIQHFKDFSPEEISQGVHVLERFQRGLVEGKLLPAAFKEIWPMDEKNPMDKQAVGSTTAPEWREILLNMEGLVDQAGIPQDHYSVDFAEQMRLLVESILDEPGSSSPAGLPSAVPSSPMILEATGSEDLEVK